VRSFKKEGMGKMIKLLMPIVIGLMASVSAHGSAHGSTVANSDPGDGLPLRIVRIQQYEDRMPVVVGHEGQKSSVKTSAARIVTLIEFTAGHCPTLEREDFALSIQDVTSAQSVEVVVKPESRANRCAAESASSFQGPTFVLSTSELEAGRPIVISNPVMVEHLPPVD
jgi:hypothetical protein